MANSGKYLVLTGSGQSMGSRLTRVMEQQPTLGHFWSMDHVTFTVVRLLHSRIEFFKAAITNFSLTTGYFCIWYFWIISEFSVISFIFWLSSPEKYLFFVKSKIRRGNAAISYSIYEENCIFLFSRLLAECYRVLISWSEQDWTCVRWWPIKVEVREDARIAEQDMASGKRD